MIGRIDRITKIIEIEFYIYIMFLFITKGEAIRNILLYSAFALWLITIPYRDEKRVLKHPVSILFFLCLSSIIPSVFFSIDPAYSLKSVIVDPLKALVTFCLASTTFTQHRSMRNLLYISLIMLAFTVYVGYYSYWAYDMSLMKPITTIRHAWHTRFAIDLATLLPFAFILFIEKKGLLWRAVIIPVMMMAVGGIILSTSRGTMAGFSVMVIWWLVYMYRRELIGKKAIAVISIALLIIGTAAYSSSPTLRNKLYENKENIMSIGRRTEIWGPLIAAASKRPIFGWGYGSAIFKKDEPFKDTRYGEAPYHKDPAFRNPHNPFLRLLFHQGVVGLVPYILLIAASIFYFWKYAFDGNDLACLILMSCASIIAGIYVVNAMTENSQLRDIALILGIGLSVMGRDRLRMKSSKIKSNVKIEDGKYA